MKKIDEGVIKYKQGRFLETDAIPQNEWERLNYSRELLYSKGLIGEYDQPKVGYGNVSLKMDYSSFAPPSGPQFLITGTQTGGLEHLNGEHYTRVLSFDVASMTLDAMGPIKASSEAITHGAIYLSSSTVVAVFHIHHDTIWKKMIEDGYPSTSPDVEYGSLDMAREVQSLVSSGTTSFVTRGHEDGIFIFGDCLESIEKETLEIYDRFNGA